MLGEGGQRLDEVRESTEADMAYKDSDNRILVPFAKSNRKEINDAENRLWHYLRN